MLELKLKLRKLLQSALRRRGYDIRWIPPVVARRPETELRVTLEMTAGWLSARRENLFFVQVGAYDGACVDPIAQLIRQHHWRGLMFEPHPEAFRQLSANAGRLPGVELVPAAVGEANGAATFYCVDAAAPGLPSKAPLISSLDRSMLLYNLGGRPEQWRPWIRETSVPVVTLNHFFAQRKIERVDLLQLDAEGYDGKILRSLDFARFRPAIIHFEHALLPVAEQQALWELLADQGYQLHVWPPDTLAARTQDF
jgi:FkbM family methyltransferase